MERVENYLRRTLKNLPENHPERDSIFRLLQGVQEHVRHITRWPEQLSEPRVWSDEEKAALLKDGAFIYLPTGETIRSQIAAKKLLGFVVDGGFEIEGRNRLLDFPSRPMEVAIYPDPERFLASESLYAVQRRTGVENIIKILPEASEATEVLIRLAETTEGKFEWPGIRHVRGLSYAIAIRTSTPTDEVGKCSAAVVLGNFSGFQVHGHPVNDNNWLIQTALWLVPA